MEKNSAGMDYPRPTTAFPTFPGLHPLKRIFFGYFDAEEHEINRFYVGFSLDGSVFVCYNSKLR